MMSIDHQKNHFKRSRDEIEEGDISKDQNTNEFIVKTKKRRLETSSPSLTNDDFNNQTRGVIDENNSTSAEFQQKMYKSFIKSALDALDNNVSMSLFFLGRS